MLNLDCEITIGEGDRLLVFDYVTELSISRSSDNFTATAFLKLPQKFFDNSNKNLFNEIRIGDPITISLGYYPNFNRRFSGYVSRRVPNSPVEIYCEDSSFLYKQIIIDPATYNKTTIGEFLIQTYPDILIEDNIFQPDRKIGNWRIAGATTFLKVLDNLRKTFGTSAYWDDNGDLFIDYQLSELSDLAGEFYYDDPKKGNIIDISNMTYQESNEFSQVVQGISEQGIDEDGNAKTDSKGNPLEPIKLFAFYDENGKIQTSEIFDGSGNINNFSIPNLTKDDLDKLIRQRLRNLNFTGFRGSFKTFGEPIVNVNDDLDIINNRQKEMNGRYRVKAVNILFNINEGYKQVIEVTRKTGEIAA